jgi:hypothetical protein
VCALPAAAADRGAPGEESMLMNIMPILCRRRSAGISHNIAQERQDDSLHHERTAILSRRRCRYAAITTTVSVAFAGNLPLSCRAGRSGGKVVTWQI